MMAQYVASIPSLRPIGSFTPEERKVLGEKANAEMAAYYADLTEKQNERNAREHLAVLCQALAQQRHRLLPYPGPDRLVVAASTPCGSGCHHRCSWRRSPASVSTR
jgi:hypothetical protein